MHDVVAAQWAALHWRVVDTRGRGAEFRRRDVRGGESCAHNELSTCSNDLRDLADYIRYNVDECVMRADLFEIDGIPLAGTLDYLAQRLEEKKNTCPCVGPCEELACKQ